LYFITISSGLDIRKKSTLKKKNRYSKEHTTSFGLPLKTGAVCLFPAAAGGFGFFSSSSFL